MADAGASCVPEADLDYGSDDEVDEPLPLVRVNSYTVKGLGLIHNYVPVSEEDNGKRCVVDGFPESGTMRFMGLHNQTDSKLFGNSGDVRCVVQIENPDGEDKVLTEKGLLVRLVKVKVAPDETILTGAILKQGGKHKSWKRRFASLDGDGCLRYYSDSKMKTLKGVIDVRRDCTDLGNNAEDASWPPGTSQEVQLTLVTEQRTYMFVCENEDNASSWRSAFARVARQIVKREIAAGLEEPIASSKTGADEEDFDSNSTPVPPPTPTPTPYSAPSTPEKLLDAVNQDDVNCEQPQRVRRHFLRTAVTNNKQTCSSCSKQVGYRTKHLICTQCRKRYHLQCKPENADCCPPAFGTAQASKRIAPPAGSNLAAAVQYSSTGGTVPGILEDIFAILESRGMIEGIYRVPGNKHEMQRLITHFFSDPNKRRLGIYAVESVHDCSSALKLFLRQLDEPLLTFELYFDIIRTVTVSAADVREEMMIHVLGRLPRHNFHTLKALMAHLRVVADKQDQTKMKISNLAAVFAPTLMQTPGNDDHAIQHVMAQMKTVDVLLKLKPASWDAAEELVIASGRENSASPVVGTTSAEKEKKDSKTTRTPVALSNEELSKDNGDTPRYSIASDLSDSVPSAEEQLPMSHLSSRQHSSRTVPIINSDVAIGSNQEEIEDLLEEINPADSFTIGDAADVVVGLADGAMLPGFEEFSLDSFGDGTVTLDAREKRKKKKADRLSGKMLGIEDVDEQ